MHILCYNLLYTFAGGGGGGGGHSCAGMLTMPRIEIATIRLPVVSWADQSFGWQNPLSGQVTIAYQ